MCKSNNQKILVHKYFKAFIIYFNFILEKELHSMELHRDFRLWLTTESHQNFPATLLEFCLKVTYESPPGIKRNLQRTLNSWSPSVFESSDNVSKAQAIFVLAWFHAIVQERRIFIPRGWCKFYEFSDRYSH